MNDFPNSQLSRNNPLLLSTLQQQPQPSSASLGLSAASRLPSASASAAAARNAAPPTGLSSLNLSSSLTNPLGLSSSAGLTRPAGLSGLSALSPSQPPLAGLHSQHLSRQGGGSGSAAGNGLLGSLSGLTGLPVNGGLFTSVLSSQSFSPDMALLLSSHSSSSAAVGGGGSGSAAVKPVGAGQVSHSHSHSHPLSVGLAGLSALGHLSSAGGGGGLHGQQQQLDNGGLLDRERDRERERERLNGPRFDMSDFPSLSEVVGGGGPKEAGLAVGMGHSASQSVGGGSSGSGGANMASLLSAPSQVGLHSPSEFSMQTEEFPALSAAVSTTAERSAATPLTHCAACPPPADSPVRSLICWYCQRRPPGSSQSGRAPSSSSSFSSPYSSSSLQQPISARTQSQPIGHIASPPSATLTLGSMLPPLTARGQSLSGKLHANNASTANSVPSPVASPSDSPLSTATSSSPISAASNPTAASLSASSTSSSQQLSQSHYGLPGLLSVIRMTDPDLNTLALGTDLTTLGLNLSSTEVLYATFAYPASATSPCITGPADYVLPYCQAKHTQTRPTASMLLAPLPALSSTSLCVCVCVCQVTTCSLPL